ncbi:MAG: hypothetical protein H0T15_04395 [Thermoleophilaceae bacterium]|nr:hypothetical protein [Thermoleophilaceae bacterium]
MSGVLVIVAVIIVVILVFTLLFGSIIRKSRGGEAKPAEEGEHPPGPGRA